MSDEEVLIRFRSAADAAQFVRDEIAGQYGGSIEARAQSYTAPNMCAEFPDLSIMDRTCVVEGGRHIHYPAPVGETRCECDIDYLDPACVNPVHINAPDLRAIRGLTSLGAVVLTFNGVAYIRQSDLIAAVDEADRIAAKP